MAREDSGLAPQASKKVDRSSHLERLPFTKKGTRLAPQASKKGRRVPERLRAPEVGVEDFIPWVSPISSRPLPPRASEEEEEEDEMTDLVHNFTAWKCKLGASCTQFCPSTLTFYPMCVTLTYRSHMAPLRPHLTLVGLQASSGLVCGPLSAYVVHFRVSSW